MADRYCVMGQVFVANGTGVITEVGRHIADITLHVTTEGDFVFTMASGTSCVLTDVGDGAAITGSPLTLAAGANAVTITGTGTITLDITIGTAAGWNTVNSWSATSGGACTASVPTTADNVFFDADSFSAASQVLTVDAAANCLDMDWTEATNTPTLAGTFALSIYGSRAYVAAMTIAYTGIVTHRPASGTTKVLTQDGQTLLGSLVLNGAGTIQLADALTKGGTASLTLTAGTFDPNGQTVSLIGTAHTIVGTWTFANLTRTGTATKTDSITFPSGVTTTITGTLTLDGNSSVNRLLVQSSTLGTAATLNAVVVACSNVDLMDIIGAGAGSWDLSAITGLSGDCGGNSGMTFAAPATQTWGVNTGSWSNAAKWTSRVPLPQDDVLIDASSITLAAQTITVDMPRIGKSIDFTGVLDSPTITVSIHSAWYGSFTLVTGMTFNAGGFQQIFHGRASYTLTSAGKVLHVLRTDVPGATLTLQDDLYAESQIQLFGGTLNLNGKNVSTDTIWSPGLLARALITGASTITVLSIWAVIKWNIGVGLTLDAAGSTIILTSSTAYAQVFEGAGKTYNNVIIAGAGDYALTIRSSNTFNILTIDRSVAAKTLKLTSGTNQRMQNLVIVPVGARVVTINAVTPGSAATMTKLGSQHISTGYLSIKDSTVALANTWYAGANSTDEGNNAGWVFAAPAKRGWSSK